ncbi:MAG: aspartate dehydrogenase [Candidatus Omnitrophica bacterium CG11_big_fil_rev_8_21_14_0_20_42_13]|uniref:L-aspartate dehydrogenase n=1 Tax=Candidatus Ghiorseimicrobium undicola TaxID=1974746 RepID=A0A2H0LWC9_9BACT|nr:MAG: aspartate dehydrogenase [Candidatus Omnitrophica bacterium CG11_big_fil_rev_8_21_14_0_20_42_13]
MEKLKIGIVGCGAIGARIAAAVCRDFKKNARLVALSDISRTAAKSLKKKLKADVVLCGLDELIEKSDFVIEAASVNISAMVVKKSILKRRSVLIMSVGGLLNRTGILSLARRRKVSVYFPSGAICGLDGLKAMALAKIKKVTLITRKPVKSLPGRFAGIKKETVIFNGNARDAVKNFPQNINVAAILSLAGVGPEKTRVCIIASPKFKRNAHTVEIESNAGKIISQAENVPSPDNPRTSYLAVLSAIATLRQVFDSVKIGT